MKRKKRTEKEWFDIQLAWEASGKTQQEYCIENKIPISSFCRWRTKLKDFNATKHNLVKIEKDSSFTSGNILIQTNYCNIAISGNEGSQTLKNIFKAIKETEYAD